MISRLIAGAMLWLLTVFPTLPASAFEPPRFDSPEQAVEEILKSFLDNDRDAFAETMTRLFGDTDQKIVNIVFSNVLTDGQTFQLADRLQTEKLGNTMARYLYLLRTSKDDYLFLLISVIETSQGWIAYDMNFNTSISKYLPDWRDP